MQLFWTLVGIGALLARVAVRDPPLHRGGELMTTLRVALLHLRVGVMNDLQYRVNFALQVLQSILAVGVGLIVFQLVFSHTTELNGWTHSELLAILGVQIRDGRRHPRGRSSRT